MKQVFLHEGKLVAANTRFFSRENTPGGNQTTTLLAHNSIQPLIPLTGNYRVSVGFYWSTDSGGTDFVSELRSDGGLLGIRQIHEPQDTAGTGITVDRLDNGGTLFTGTNQRYRGRHSDIVSYSAGDEPQIEFLFAASTTFDEATVYWSLIEVEWFNE